MASDEIRTGMQVEILRSLAKYPHGFVQGVASGKSEEAGEFEVVTDIGLGGMNLFVKIKPIDGRAERVFVLNGRDVLDACLNYAIETNEEVSAGA